MISRVLVLFLILLPAFTASGAEPAHEESRQVMGTLALVAAWS